MVFVGTANKAIWVLAPATTSGSFPAIISVKFSPKNTNDLSWWPLDISGRAHLPAFAHEAFFSWEHLPFLLPASAYLFSQVQVTGKNKLILGGGRRLTKMMFSAVSGRHYFQEWLSIHTPACHLPDASRAFPITPWIDWDSPPLTVPTPWAHLLNWSACLSPPSVLGAPSGQEAGHAQLWTPMTGPVPGAQHGSVNAFDWNKTEGTAWWPICAVFVGEIAAYRMTHEDLLGGGRGVLNKTSMCEYRCLLLTGESPVDLFFSWYARLFLLFPFS